ncbi:MAG: response regulator [Candidatus Taylorbacteria bacterium]|nr:response regulator [Candidatus Taylorbacteria bacterium]
MANATKKILLVDDELELIDIYTATLKDAGYVVITAIDGPEGLEKARTEKPDLILLDLKMPKMSGLQVLAKLKADQELKNIKVIFLTAFSDPLIPAIDVTFSQYMGATDLIKKGISLADFVSKVRSYVGT